MEICIEMNMEDYEERKFRTEINDKPAEAEIEAEATTTRYSREEAMKILMAGLNAQKV